MPDKRRVTPRSCNHLPRSGCSIRSVGTFLAKIGRDGDRGHQCRAGNTGMADVWYFSPLSRDHSKARSTGSLRPRRWSPRSASTAVATGSTRCGRTFRHRRSFKPFGCNQLLRTGTKEGDRVAYRENFENVNGKSQAVYFPAGRCGLASGTQNCSHLT